MSINNRLLSDFNLYISGQCLQVTMTSLLKVIMAAYRKAETFTCYSEACTTRFYLNMQKALRAEGGEAHAYNSKR
jgi:peroxiredoxin